MPIVGVTDRSSHDFPLNLATIGQVWKGEEKSGSGSSTRPGKDLENRLRVSFRDSRWEKKFLEAYGTLQPETLNIYLPFQTVDRCFPTWYTAFSSQGFKHRCDGMRIVEEMVATPYSDRDGNKLLYEKQRVDKPCLRGDRPVCPECGPKGSGLLTFYIRELYSAGSGATRGFTMSVGGRNDLPRLYEQLKSLEERYGALSGSPFMCPQTFGYIPYVLSRVKTPITKPIVEKVSQDGRSRYNHTGGRSQSYYWALSIAEDPEWLVLLQKYYQEQQLLRLREHPELARLYGDESIALPAAKPALPAAKADPIFLDRLSAIRQFTGHSKHEAARLCADLAFKPEDAIADEECFLMLRRSMLIDWASTQYGMVWKHARHCSNAFDKMLRSLELPNDASGDTLLIREWESECNQRLETAMEQAAETIDAEAIDL